MQSARVQTPVIPAYEVVIIAAPAAALDQARTLVVALPPWFDVPVLIATIGDGDGVQHDGVRFGTPIRPAHSGTTLDPGAFYVAPTREHLVLTRSGRAKRLIENADGGDGLAPLIQSAVS